MPAKNRKNTPRYADHNKKYLIEETCNTTARQKSGRKILAQKPIPQPLIDTFVLCRKKDFCFSPGMLRTFSRQHLHFWLWLDHQVSPLKQSVRKTVKWQGYGEGNEEKTAGSREKHSSFLVCFQWKHLTRPN